MAGSRHRIVAAWITCVATTAIAACSDPNAGGETEAATTSGQMPVATAGVDPDSSSAGSGGGASAGSSSANASSSSADPTTTGAEQESTASTLTGATTGGVTPDLDPLPPLTRATLTDERTLEPEHFRSPVPYLDPRRPADLDRILAERWGKEVEAPGEAHTDFTLPNEAVPTRDDNAEVLARFVHLADPQVPDDESPARFVHNDAPWVSAPFFRPQEAYACHILNASVRTVNAIHADDPLDLVILGGDNIDSGQKNELSWFLDVMSGVGNVHCDSGVDDDPVPGPGNDPKDPFRPVGLDVPWIWVSGNHDLLVQGHLPSPEHQRTATGELADGTRDWSQPGGPVVSGMVPADLDRLPLPSSVLLRAVMEDGDGHGLTQAAVDAGRAMYVKDVAGSPLRLIVVESTAPTGGFGGLVHDSDVSSFIAPELDQAMDDGKIVIMVTHHPSDQFTNGGTPGGTATSDYMEPDEWRDLLASYDNVLLHLAGHSHNHDVRVIDRPARSYWEVLTAAIADYPHQLRVIEILRHHGTDLEMRMTVFDYSVEDDTLAAAGRERGIADLTSGWRKVREDGPEDRNVALWSVGFGG